MIPFFNALLKGRKAEGPNNEHRPIAITTDGAAKVELSTATSPVFPGAAPPADITGQSLWLNTNTGADGIYFYDLSRSKWLDINEVPLLFGDDAADNQVMRVIGVNTPGNGTGLHIPVAVDVTLTRVYALARDGNQTKSFDIRRRVVNGATAVVDTFTMSGVGPDGSVFVDESLDLDVAGGANVFLDVFAEAAGFSSRDITIQLFYRRRGA
jgi:hypothetical protein